MQPYRYTDLNEHSEWLNELGRLEARMTASLGEEVRLVAYSPETHELPSESACRAGLDD
ncbi:hypothetical protein [Gorillibacterium sp. sgz500922]|uniref:hypothetical protein n=1 Tax=Gorillibacterium sp. sgz500922 TaxID=3446694 RepID=UPI003F66A81E